MSRVTLISGSPSASSKSAAILEYIRHQLLESHNEVSAFSIRDFPPEDLVLGKYDSPAFQKIKQEIESSVAVVISTPVYKASYTGGLKALLDILPQAALKGKIILPLASGGSPAHLLSIDFALKPVLSALGATNQLQGVYVIDKELVVNPEGKVSFPPELQERLDAAIQQLLVEIARH